MNPVKNAHKTRKAIIIGAGPAGLTAAFELLTRTDVQPIVIEKSTYMGGISRTVEYKGNRIDIGGHRFFSKSDRVMDWWLQHMPLDSMMGRGHSHENGNGNGAGSIQLHAANSIGNGSGNGQHAGTQVITYQNQKRPISINAPTSNGDAVMLLRERKSRIYFLRKFFEYPIQFSIDTLRNLGLIRILKIGVSYMRAMIFPPKRIKNLEEFFISRFGRELYKTFFKSYTEKVWGVPCDQISAEWGAQRIKGLSILKTVSHLFKKMFKSSSDVRQKDTETSLIEQFMYPKFGPGQMWEIVAQKVREMDGEILTEMSVEEIHTSGDRIHSISARDRDGLLHRLTGDYFFSTMPIKELVNALQTPVPADIREIANGLQYRDFVTVGLLVNKLVVKDKGKDSGDVKDNWIYIQEPDVTAGRLQIFNNWSPYLVRDPNTVWIGVEYFCYDTDPFWRMSDEETAALAKRELERIGIIRQEDVLDYTVIRMPKTYPAYFGAYERFEEVREYLDSYENLFLVGRNGMHKYNNQDHSMLTAMTAVDNIKAGRVDKSNIWAVNTEMEYHEEKAPEEQERLRAA